MKKFETRALVLREYEAGESDKRLLLLCKGIGRITVYARGARKVRSKFLAASQMFTYGDYVLVDGGQFFSLSQGAVIENFFAIRQDYERLACAQQVLEICEKAVPERTPCDELLRLALKALQHFSRAELPGKQILSVFMFRFFLYSGLAPEMGEGDYFCDEGMVARSEKTDKLRIPLSSAARAAICHILEADTAGAFLFRAEAPVLDELARAAHICWLGHFHITLHTLA